jgi:hypothetical protein
VPRVLTKLRIDEISTVDAAANGGARIVLYKRSIGEHASNKHSEANMADHFVEVCKRLGDGDPTIIVPSETELFGHIQKYASDHRLSGESPAAAFARIFSASDDTGLALRKAVQVAKGHPHPHVGA